MVKQINVSISAFRTKSKRGRAAPFAVEASGEPSQRRRLCTRWPRSSSLSFAARTVSEEQSYGDKERRDMRSHRVREGEREPALHMGGWTDTREMARTARTHAHVQTASAAHIHTSPRSS